MADQTAVQDVATAVGRSVSAQEQALAVQHTATRPTARTGEILPPKKKRRGFLLPLILLAAIGGGGYEGYHWFTVSPRPRAS